MEAVRQALRSRGFTPAVVNTMMESRRKSSQKLYGYYLTKWNGYCMERHLNYTQAAVPHGLAFLQTLKDAGIGYSTLNTARSALSTVLVYGSGLTFGNHPDVRTFMKGVANLSPPVPRYTHTWDVSVVLTLLKRWSPATKIPLDKLAMKLVMLILLVSGQRPQIFRALTINNMELGAASARFVLEGKDLKQGRLGYRAEPVVLKAYPADRRLCVFTYMKAYLRRTLDIRGRTKQLILTTKRPIRGATVNTISRWVRTVLKTAGVDTSVFKPGSVRAASVSKAKVSGVPVEEILKAGGWSRLDTFARFYDKPIKKSSGFADRVLDG